MECSAPAWLAGAGGWVFRYRKEEVGLVVAVAPLGEAGLELFAKQKGDGPGG